MAKKHLGRFLTFAAIAGAAAAGISYFLQYKSFHKELDEEFHDFEDDFDEFEDTDDNQSSTTRNYVSLTPERKNDITEEDCGCESGNETADEKISALAGDSPAAPSGTVQEVTEETKETEPAEENKGQAPADATVTVEEMTE